MRGALSASRRGLIGPALALLAASLLFAVFHSHGFDDPYITYRYAANLAAGIGFVYNPGAAVLSTTAPLYALLLAPAAILGMDLPLLSNLVSCLSLGAGGVALWKLGLVNEEPLAGAAAAAFYTLSPWLIITIGGETSFVLGLVLWAFVAASQERWSVVAVLLGLGTIVRADTALVGLVLGAELLARRWQSPLLRSLPWRAAAIYLLILSPWLIFAQVYFGSPVPVTLAAKRRQATIDGSRGFGEGLLSNVQSLWALPAYRLLLILALVGVGYCLLRRRAALALLAWSALYSLAYTLLGVTNYFWYYSPVYLGIVAAAGMGVAAVATGLRLLPVGRLAPAVALALAALAVAAEVGDLAKIAARPDPRLALYRDVSAWLLTNTPADASVGTLEVGIIGYYSRRPIIDFAGLIQPEVAAQFDKQHGYLDATRWAVEHYRPSYLALPEVTMQLRLIDPALTDRCTVAATFPDARFAAPLRVYHCNWAAP